MEAVAAATASFRPTGAHVLRLIFYGQPDGPENAGIAALADGAKALGNRVIWRNHMFFRPGEYEDADLFVIMGMQGPISLFPAEAKKRDRRALVCDLAMLCRGRTYYVGFEKTNWVPSYECDETRLDQLGVTLEPHLPGGGAYMLVAPQMPNDAAHGLNHRAMDTWLERTLRELEAAGKEYRVRPHPRVAQAERSLDEDLAGAAAVITINSNIGHDALRRGIPVFCRKDAPYAAVANPYDERTMRPFDKSPRFPGDPRRRQYFARVAHSEWDLDELRSGRALDFLLGIIAKERDGDEADPLPADEAEESTDTHTGMSGPRQRRSRRTQSDHAFVTGI
jgi:hypothetical protein